MRRDSARRAACLAACRSLHGFDVRGLGEDGAGVEGRSDRMLPRTLPLVNEDRLQLYMSTRAGPTSGCKGPAWALSGALLIR